MLGPFLLGHPVYVQTLIINNQIQHVLIKIHSSTAEI